MKISSHPEIIRAGSLLAADALFFSLTNPLKVASWLLIAGFGLAAATLYYFLRSAVRVASWYGLPVSRRQQRRVAEVAGILIGLLALQSIGQLSPRDVLVLLPLLLVTYLYSSYGRGHDVADS